MHSGRGERMAGWDDRTLQEKIPEALPEAREEAAARERQGYRTDIREKIPEGSQARTRAYGSTMISRIRDFPACTQSRRAEDAGETLT